MGPIYTDIDQDFQKISWLEVLTTTGFTKTEVIKKWEHWWIENEKVTSHLYNKIEEE